MRSIPMSLLLVGLLAVMAGCATKDYVNEQGAVLGQRIDGLDTRLSGFDRRLGSTESSLSATTTTANDALALAAEAKRGKLLYEVTLTDDQVKFASGKSVISGEGKAALDEVANRIKADNKGVWIEIQGHTDKTGTKALNQRLGQARADAVRDYLYAAGIPLHRMSVVSLGSSQPATTDKGRAARAQNRRVEVFISAFTG